MAKISLITVESLENQTSVVQALNENFGLIEAALENTFSLDGTAPNAFLKNVDANSKRIINVGAPINGTDAARLVDIADAMTVNGDIFFPAFVDEAILSNEGGVLVWRDPLDIPGLGDLKSTENLSELSDISTARTNLGLGTSATEDVGTTGDVIGKLNTNNTVSGNNTYSGTSSFTGAVTLGGTVDHRLTTVATGLTPESIGFRGSPIATQDATYSFVLNDAGRTKLHTSATGHTYTIPLNATVAFPVGTLILLYNIGAGAVTVSRAGGVVLRRAGVATDANATLAQWGFATLMKIDTNSWLISGTGVT